MLADAAFMLVIYLGLVQFLNIPIVQIFYGFWRIRFNL